MVRNPLLGSLGDNFKMRVKGITGHRYVSHSTVSVDGPSSTVEQEKLSLMSPTTVDFGRFPVDWPKGTETLLLKKILWNLESLIDQLGLS